MMYIPVEPYNTIGKMSNVIICALCLALCTIVWLPTIAQSITAEHFRLSVEERVQHLSLVADDAYLNIIENITGQINQSCPYGNQLYDTCSVMLQPKGIAFDETFMRNVSTFASSVYFRQFLAGYAALFSSIDDYQLVEDLFSRLCMSEALSHSWILLGNTSVNNTSNDGLLWHFYGDDQTAIIRTYPYFSHDPSSDLCKRRQLDPRFRPWYVSTATSAKVLYVLIHSNYYDMLPLMREAAMRLLNTLSHQDYFYIWLNHNDGSRYNDSFVRTNQSNRQLLEQFITSATAQQLIPTLNIALQLEEAFQLFRSLGSDSVCHQAIMLLSDSSLDKSIVNRVNMVKQQNDSVQQIDIYTMIFGLQADDNDAALLSCSNGGDHYVVRDMEDVDEAVGSYYKFYSAAVAMETNDRQVSWSEVYSDFFLGENVLSACLPIRDVSTAMLLGVTCIDVNVTYFKSLSNGEQVVSTLVNASSIQCPNVNITEEMRNQLRSYRYCERPANLSTVDQIIVLYEDVIEEVIDLLISAERDVRNILNGSPELCPYGATVYDACSDESLPYAFDARFHNNVTNITSNVNFSPTTLDWLGDFPLVDYTTDNPLFVPLCYSSIANRRWSRLLALNPYTALQYYASDEGFVRLYPAIRYDSCYPPSYDPRTRPFYATAASGRKDVIMVIDIANSTSVGISVAIAAINDVLNTLSVLDYFNVISSSVGSFSDTGLTAATEANKSLLNTSYLPNVVAMVSDQSSLINMTFKAIIDGRNNNNTANCQIAVIIITDRQITSDTAEAVANGNRNLQSYQIEPAKIFVTSLTNDPTSYLDAMAVQLTCNHSGIWNKVSSSAYSHNSTVSVISYYRVLASAVMVTQPVWSEIYEDYTGNGDVITVCQPHYDENVNIGQLLGVACADVTIEMLQQVGASIELIEELIDQQSLLPCRPTAIPIATLELLRPMDAKCFSVPPTISSATSSTTVSSSATPTIITSITSSVTSSSTVAISSVVSSATPTIITSTASYVTSSSTAATTISLVVSSATPTNQTISGSPSDNRLTGGAIAGIVIACVVMLTIILIVIIGWYQYRNIRHYRLQETYNYKKFSQGHDNELSHALVSEVEDDERDEL